MKIVCPSHRTCFAVVSGAHCCVQPDQVIFDSRRGLGVGCQALQDRVRVVQDLSQGHRVQAGVVGSVPHVHGAQVQTLEVVVAAPVAVWGRLHLIGMGSGY